MKNLDLLVPQQKRVNDTFLWATVTQANPLRIRLDGDIDPLPSTPDSLVSGLRVGQRAWVQLSGHQVIVLSGYTHNPIPAGVIQMWGGTGATIPAGWIACGGQSYATATYPDLFAAIGYNFGGSGANFNVPNFSNRFPTHAASGTTGGSSTKTLSAANMQHHHTTPNHTHTHNLDVSDASLGLATNTTTGGTGSRLTGDGDGLHDHALTGGITPSGGGDTGAVVLDAPTAFDVMNPWLGVNFIIKT